MNTIDKIPSQRYESLIQPLRKRIDAIDISILSSIRNLLDIFEGHLLSRGLSDSFLLETPQQYISIFRAIFGYIEQKTIREQKHEPIDIADETGVVTLMKRAVNLAQMHSEVGQALDENRVMEILNRISCNLDERFKIVQEVGALKGEFQKPPMDEERWNQVLESRKDIWKILGGKNGKILIPAIWNPIHDIALKIEQEELKEAELKHWMDENGLLSVPHYNPGVLEIQGNPKSAGHASIDTMQRTLEGYRGTLEKSPNNPQIITPVPVGFFH